MKAKVYIPDITSQLHNVLGSRPYTLSHIRIFFHKWLKSEITRKRYCSVYKTQNYTLASVTEEPARSMMAPQSRTRPYLIIENPHHNIECPMSV